MPKVKSRLTSKEQKCLIDFDEISPERHDFALMLLCSRSLYRIQLRCFEHNVLNNQDICDIVQREVDRLPKLLSVIGASLEANGSYNANHHENLMMLDFCKQITNSNDPLDIIRSLLTAEQNSRSLKSSSDKKVKKMYRNLINLIDDLKKFMQNRNSTDDSTTNLSTSTSTSSSTTRKRNNFRPVYFMGNYCVCTEGIPGSGEETFIHPPTALLWLPVLTNKERITQHTTSAFSLRKKTEFAKNNGPSFRPQLLRMNFVQTFGRKQLQQSSTTKSEKLRRVTNNSSQQSQQSQNSQSSQQSQSTQHQDSPSSSYSHMPVTSINAILNHKATNTSLSSNDSQPVLVKPTPKRVPFSINTDIPRILSTPRNDMTSNMTSNMASNMTPNMTPNMTSNMVATTTSYMTPVQSPIASNCNCSPLSATRDFRKLCPCIVNMSTSSSSQGFNNSSNNPLLSPPLFTGDFSLRNSHYNTSTRNYSYGYNSGMSINYDGSSSSSSRKNSLF
ncbi:23998_t:CDS:1 [Cetraspora pellucida]|uniref:23998_t:CDS:1 n=1 Tax=Cetraspora pellucida TaxID=1433469 RepID=A0A9N8WGY6_9GLOM|nr:23998_t:CDS:1 [Cetraspora pellucida]